MAVSGAGGGGVRATDIAIRYVMQVVDQTRKGVQADKNLRSSVMQTDKMLRAQTQTVQKLGNTVSQTATRSARASQTQVRASRAVTQAQRQEAAGQRTLTREHERGAAATRRQATAQSALARSLQQVQTRAREAARAVQDLARRQAEAARSGGGGVGLRGSIGAGAAGGLAGRGRFALAGGAAAVGLGGAGLLSNVVGFEKSMARVSALMLTTGDNMRRLTNLSLELGAKTQFSARQAADAMGELAAQGFTTNQIMKTLPGTLNLAAASGVELADAAQIQAQTLRGFRLEAGEAGRVADVLAQIANKSAVDMYDLQESIKYIAPVAAATGQSLETMGAAIGIMGNVGIRGSQAGTTLRTAMVRLTNPTEKAASALGDLGLKAADLRGPKGLLPLPKIMGMIVKGAQGVDKSTRNAALASIFGREALSGMVAMVEGGPKAFNKWIRSLQDSEGAADRAAKKLRDTVGGAWDNFTGSIETASIKLLSRFLPALQTALNKGAEIVNSSGAVIGDFLAGVGGDAGPRVRPARGPVRPQTGTRTGGSIEPPTGAQRVGAAVREAGGKVFDVLKKGAAAALPVVTKFVKDMIEAWKPAAPYFKNVLLPVLMGLGKALWDTIVVVLKLIPPIAKVVATVLGAIGKAAAPLVPVFKLVGYAIGIVFGPGIIKAVGTALKSFGLFGRIAGTALRAVGTAANVLQVVIGKAFGMILRLMRPVAAFIVRSFLGAFNRARAIVTTVGRAIVGAVRGVVSGVGRAIGVVRERIITPVRNGFNAVVDFIGGIVGRVRQKAGEVVGAIVNAFKGIAGKILGAMTAAPGAMGGFVVSLANGVIKLVENAINSVDKIGPISVPDVHLPRFQGGGRATGAAMVSPGELAVEPGGRAYVIPGAPTPADNVMGMFPAGTAIITGHGQSLLAQGASVQEALANQLPHFREGGMVRAIKAARAAKFRGKGLQLAGAVAGAESVNFTQFVGDNGQSWGPWQIHAPSHPGLQYRRMINDWTYAATQAHRISGGGRNWNPWTVYRTGAYRRHMSAAASAIRRTGGGDNDPARIRTRLQLGSKAPSAVRTWAGGFQAGLEGTPLWDVEVLPELVRSGSARISRERINQAGGGAGGSGGARFQRMVSFANRLEAMRIPYGPQGHASLAINRAGEDCSSTVSKVLHAGGYLNQVHTTATFPSAGLPRGAGRYATIYNRPYAGSAGHMFMKLGNRYFGTSTSNPSGGPGWFSPSPGYINFSNFPQRFHPQRAQGGGIVTAAGVTPGRALGRRLQQTFRLPVEGGDAKFRQIMRQFANSIERLDDLSADLLRGRIATMRATLQRVRRRIRQIRRGGVTRAERGTLRALRERIGDLPDEISELRTRFRPPSYRRLTAMERNIGRRIRAIERGGIEGREERVQVRRFRAMQRLVQLEQGRRTGMLVGRVGARFEALGGAQTRFEQGLRLGNIGGDSARGLSLTADFQRNQLAQMQAMQGQLRIAMRRARRRGDRNAIRQIQEQMESISSSIRETTVSIAETVRAQIEAAAAEQTAAATHGVTWARTMFERLELQQRLAGTYEGGGAARADFIRQQIIPRLQGELGALQGQAAAAAQTGNTELARQIAEAIWSKENEIMQAQLDAQEQTASNTDALKEFGGILGFDFGGRQTDKLADLGVGA